LKQTIVRMRCGNYFIMIGRENEALRVQEQSRVSVGALALPMETKRNHGTSGRELLDKRLN